MKDIVMVPTFRRDPLLYLCLEAIRREDLDVPIAVFSDRGYTSVDLRVMVEEFRAMLMIRAAHGYGNSWNVIASMSECAEADFQIVHVIEDDTILHGGYLAWAREILNPASAYACCLGRRPADLLSTWYESPCVSWKSFDLRKCLEKVPLDYFADTREEMQKAIDAKFPKSKYKYGSAEQDGFFLRCLESMQSKVAIPPISFASHIGFYGYNRPPGYTEPEGTFEQKVDFCRKLLYDRVKRGEWFGDNITEREMEGLK